MIKIDDRFTEQFTPNEQLVMLRLLLSVNEDGVVGFSTRKLAELCGLTRQNVRSILTNLSKKGELVIDITTTSNPIDNPTSNPRLTFVTICNFDTYKVGKRKVTQQVTQQVTQDKTTLSKSKKSLKEREHEFGASLIPYVEKYSKETIRAFFNYWSEKSKIGAYMRFELEKTWETSKRLQTWASREKVQKSNTALKSSEMNYDKDSDW
ncbi:hypothetical protein [Prevotella pallens]|uniref:hypothetical protein n=1 Tax=Prevotella pallens TaxID=60133 RepID=UPI003C7C523F